MDYKRCRKCGSDKPTSDFYQRYDGTGKPHSNCKKCQNKYYASYYKTNKKRYDRISLKSKVEKMRAVIALKRDKPCADCGLSFHPVAMDFDHVGSNKVFSVSRMVQRRISIKRILAETAKCELVCSNCHRIRTHNRRLSSSSSMVERQAYTLLVP